MTLSIDGQPGDVSRRVTYLSARSPAKSDARVGKAKRADDPWAHQTEGQVADLKRRIPILKRLIDRLRSLGRRSRSGDPERGGPRQNPRSGTFRLFDLCQGDGFETR